MWTKVDRRSHCTSRSVRSAEYDTISFCEKLKWETQDPVSARSSTVNFFPSTPDEPEVQDRLRALPVILVQMRYSVWLIPKWQIQNFALRTQKCTTIPGINMKSVQEIELILPDEQWTYSIKQRAVGVNRSDWLNRIMKSTKLPCISFTVNLSAERVEELDVSLPWVTVSWRSSSSRAAGALNVQRHNRVSLLPRNGRQCHSFQV